MAVILKCPHCETKFKVKFGTADGGGWPDYCPNDKCGVYMGVDRADDDVVMPAFLSPRTKANDKVFRDMADGSEVRMKIAAEQVGAPVSEMSAMKITNMHDNQREGDIAAIEVRNLVTEVMAQAPGLTGFQANGSQFAAASRSGPFPNAGAKVVTTMSNLHEQNVRALATSGKRG